jgi:hypothetical protein
MVRACVLFSILVATVNAAESIKLRTIAQGNFSGVHDLTQIVVTNSTQWQELWAKHSAQRTPAEKTPEIDFDKETVLFAALGRRNAGGHKIEISKVKPSGDEFEVTVNIRGPKPGGIQIQALTAPFHIAAVPKLAGPVKFTLTDASTPTR